MTTYINKTGGYDMRIGDFLIRRADMKLFMIVILLLVLACIFIAKLEREYGEEIGKDMGYKDSCYCKESCKHVKAHESFMNEKLTWEEAVNCPCFYCRRAYPDQCEEVES